MEQRGRCLVLPAGERSAPVPRLTHLTSRQRRRNQLSQPAAGRHDHIETMLTMLSSLSRNQAALVPSNSAMPSTVLRPISGTS